MAKTIIVESSPFVYSHCINCGIPYIIPETMWNEQKKDGGFHKCPNGHSQGWDKGNTDMDRLRRERDRLKQQAAQKDDEIIYEREQKEREKRKAAAARGQVTKMKNRAGNGVCPCCSRSFQNLHRHMKSKHPEYGTPALKVVGAA